MIESEKKLNDIDFPISSIYNKLSIYKNITSPIIQFVANKNKKKYILVSPERSPIIQLKPNKQINEFTRLVSRSPELSPIVQISSNVNRCMRPVIRPMPSPELSPIVQISSYKIDKMISNV